MTIGEVTIDLTQVFLAIVVAIFGYITKVLVPLFKQKMEEMKQNGEEKKVARIQTAVNVGVFAADQLYEYGKDKLQHAMKTAESELLKSGIEIDESELRNYIEAEVKKLKITLASTEKPAIVLEEGST